MDKEIVGQKILKARQARGLTQAELSEVSSISIRTIQRLESGDVIPRVYTLKTLSKYLGIDLLNESEDSEEMDNKNFIHDLLIKWIKGIKNLFNLKTYTMKKIIILSSVFCAITFGLFAITKELKVEKYNLTQSSHLHGDLTPKDKNAPCGFYAQIIDGDTTYCGLITEDYTSLKEIAPNLGHISDFGYLFELKSVDFKKREINDIKSGDKPKQDEASAKSEPLLDWIGFKLSVPGHNFVDSLKAQFDTTGNSIIGFYYNSKFSSPIGIGGLDEKYFRDHYDLKEVFNKFKNVANIDVILNNKPVDKSDYDELADYEIVNLSDVRSVIVYKENDDCEIIIKTKNKH